MSFFILVLTLIFDFFGQGQPPTFEIYVLEDGDEDEKQQQQQQGMQVEPDGGNTLSSSLTPATNLRHNGVHIK